MLETLRRGLTGFTKKLSTYEITEENVNDALKDLQLLLIKNDVSVEVAEKITKNVSRLMSGTRIKRFSDKRKILSVALKHSLVKLLTPTQPIDIFQLLNERKETTSYSWCSVPSTNTSSITLSHSLCQTGTYPADNAQGCALAACQQYHRYRSVRTPLQRVNGAVKREVDSSEFPWRTAGKTGESSLRPGGKWCC